MTRTQNKENCEKNLIFAVLKLLKRNVSTLVMWEHKGKLKHFGSSSMCEWYRELDDDTTQNLTSKMVEDMLMDNQLGQDLLLLNLDEVPEDEKVSAIYQSLTIHPMHPQGSQVGPF